MVRMENFAYVCFPLPTAPRTHKVPFSMEETLSNTHAQSFPQLVSDLRKGTAPEIALSLVLQAKTCQPKASFIRNGHGSRGGRWFSTSMQWAVLAAGRCSQPPWEKKSLNCRNWMAPEMCFKSLQSLHKVRYPLFPCHKRSAKECSKTYGPPTWP